MEPRRICVVGAGVVGLSAAYRLVHELPRDSVKIDIIADTWYHETTSYRCGGLWEPYQIAGTPDEAVNEWGRVAFHHFQQLLFSRDPAGVQLLTCYSLLEAHQDQTPPSWKDVVLNFKSLSAEDIQKMGLPAKYVGGYTFGTLVVEQKYYLKWLMDRLAETGIVSFQQRKLDSIEALYEQGYDVIVNCSGLGAFHLNNDKEMYPVRGQVLRLRAPWMNNVWFFGSSYIIPNVDSVVVGGTAQKGDWNTTSSREDINRILADAYELFPSLQDAQIVRADMPRALC